LAAGQNLAFGLAHRDFRTFVHPPAAMLAVLAEHGLRPIAAYRGPVWQVAAATR
jgi:magnesium-protoporphyrin O-methyltransferase